MMHGHGKSDSAIVAVKPANKAVLAAAELVEPRAGAKGNVRQQGTCRAQYRESVSQALERIRQAAAAACRHVPEARAVCINVHVRICAGGGE
jgi:RNA-directed DNA polymerase